MIKNIVVPVDLENDLTLEQAGEILAEVVQKINDIRLDHELGCKVDWNVKVPEGF